MNVSERFKVVKSNKLCKKCFSPFHQVSDCKRFDCTKCKGKHNTMLYREQEFSQPSSTSSAQPEKEKIVVSTESSKTSLLSANYRNCLFVNCWSYKFVLS